MAAIKEGLLPPRDEHIQGRLKDILPATKAILTNKTFMLNTCAFCCTTLIATGLGPFVSKFIQSQFGKSSSTAGKCGVQIVRVFYPLQSRFLFCFWVYRERVKCVREEPASGELWSERARVFYFRSRARRSCEQTTKSMFLQCKGWFPFLELHWLYAQKNKMHRGLCLWKKNVSVDACCSYVISYFIYAR